MTHRQSKSRVEGRGRRGMRGGLITAGVLAGVVSVPALAGPQGEQVVHGQARFFRSGNHTQITTSDRAIINYDSFNLNRFESVRFVQPNAQSRVLNRISSDMPTLINGSIFANGNVYFVNRAGIYFGQNSVINVGGLYAAAGNMSNRDFLNNVNRFTDLQGAVVNRGEISASREAHLVGRRVANFGSVVAPDGLITMSAGKDVLLGEQGGRVFARISGDASNNGRVGVENHGVIDAGSGRVIAGVGDHFALALYDTSVIRGSSVRVAGGAESTVKVSGEIDATSDTGRGGSIDVLGGRIGLYGAELDASGARAGGEIHIGGDYQGVGDRLRSEVTLVDSATSLSVDATRHGHAGRAIVWSDGATVFRGSISGRGQNKGGFAEVSSLGYLDFNGSFDLSGAVRNGTLLLDPKNIYITPTDVGGATAIGDVDDFSVDSSLTTTIHDDLLSSWLNGGVAGDVMLKANNDIVFAPFAEVVQNPGETNSLRLFAGRRVAFGVNSSLVMGGGSLFAIANAVNEVGFVAADRDAGPGSIFMAPLSRIDIQGAGQVADFRIDAVGGTPGSAVMLGALTAPTVNIAANAAASQVLLGDDNNALTPQVGVGSDMTISAGNRVAFINLPGTWSFGSLDVTAPQTIFDANAAGVSATAGSLRFAGTGAGLRTDTTGLFTMSGPVTLETGYTAFGGVLFDSTLSLGGDIAAGGMEFQGGVTLTDSVSLTLNGVGNMLFGSTVEGTGVATEDLTINLAGLGDLTFNGQVGQILQSIGDVAVNGLTGTFSVNDFFFANSLTSTSGAGTVSLGNDGDLIALLAPNGTGNALEIDAAATNLAGNILATSGAVSIMGPLTVAGDRSIGTLGANGQISLGSVVLDASAGDTNLTLNTFAGGGVLLADGAGESVVRDPSGANNADLNINSFGSGVTLGDVLANGAADNFLRLVEIQAGAGTVDYAGTRYAAETLTLNASAHNLANADTVFGDAFGTTGVTTNISFLGGNLNVAGGRTLELNANGAGGNVALFGARANAAGSRMVLRATDTVSLGTGDLVGGGGGSPFASIDVVAADANIGNALFVTDLLLDPTSDSLTFGGANAGSMSIDAGEIATLNAGSIGTLSLGSNDRANFAAYNGSTTLIGGTPLTGVAQLDVFGNTTVSGGFVTSAAGVNFFGPTVLADNASVQTNASQVRFFSSLTAGNSAALTDTGNGLISFVNTVPVPAGAEVAAAINAAVGGGSLTINAGPNGTVTLFDVGPAVQLASLNATGGTINFRGQRYDAAAQVYTADAFNLLGDGPGAPGNAIAFAGVTPGTNVQTLSFIDQGGGANATLQISSGVAVNAMLDGAFLSEAAVVGTGGTESLSVNAGSIQLDRAIGANAIASRLGSVSLTSDTIAVSNVFTIGNQTYAMLNNGAAGTLTLNGGSYNASGPAAIALNGFAGDSAVLTTGTNIATGNGGTVSLGLPSIAGAGNGLVINAGPGGTITFGSGIQVVNSAQTYLAANHNFLGGATLSSAAANGTISFLGGSVNLGGDLTVQSTGAGAGINFANNQIVLGGSNLFATANGANGGVVLSNLVSAGGESVVIRTNGATVLNGASGVGLGVLDLQTDTLAINAGMPAGTVRISTFGNSAARAISVGDDASLIPGTLNLSNASLANLLPLGGGSSLLIGGNAYAGQILIGNATIGRDVAFVSNGGLVRIAGTGLNGTAGMTSLSMTAPNLQIGGAIQGASPFSVAFNGPVNVFGTADIDTNGGAVVFGDAINGLNPGSGFLDVNTAGGAITLREALGAIGSARSLARLSLVGSPTLRLTGAMTTGDQLFQTAGGVITLLDGAAFMAGDGADILFANNAAALGDAQATVGANGSVSFAGLLDGVGDSFKTVTLTTGSNGVVNLAQVGGPGGLGTLTVNAGTINLGSNLTLLKDLNLTADQTLLAGDTQMSALAFRLLTDIDSAGAAASLTLEDAITTLIQGRLGGNSPLSTFTSSDVGSTTLTGGVFSDGLALFRNAVIVSGDATVQSFGADANAGIRFLDLVDGTNAGADSLTLIVDRSSGQLIPGPQGTNQVVDSGVPVIALYDSVGSRVSLGTLNLNFGLDANGNAVDGRGFVPANATVVFGNSDAFFSNGSTTDITLNADNLFMGVREKMSVLGSLNASGATARLGDITTIGNMSVNYGAVTVLLREAGDIFDPTTGVVTQDSGVDYVAGGTIDFGQIVALLGTGDNPEFSLPGGDASVQSSAGAFLFKSLDTAVSDLIVSGTTILDVRADGPTNTNVAEALAGAVPQEQQAEPVVADVALSQVALDALVDLGIVIKQPSENLYLIDLPDDLAGSSDTARVSRRRLEPTLVTTLVSDYDEALKETAPVETAQGESGEADPATVSVIRRDAEIKATLDEAWEAFTSEVGEDGTAAEFYAFVQANSDRFGDAVVEIERLREVVASARVLGLTEREISAVKTKMFTMMQPNMGPRAFRDLIETGPAVLMGVR